VRRSEVWPASAIARQAMRPALADREVVARAHGPLPLVVDHDQLVRHVEHQVALPGRPRQAQADGLELEPEVVAERAVQSEVRVHRTGKQLS